MKKHLSLIVGFWLLAFSAHGVEVIDEHDVNEVSKNLKCLVCENQSVAESQSDFARHMKDEIMQYLSQGYQEKEIYDVFVKRYGEEILLDPFMKDHSISLWLVPFIFVIIGGIFYGLNFKRARS